MKNEIEREKKIFIEPKGKFILKQIHYVDIYQPPIESGFIIHHQPTHLIDIYNSFQYVDDILKQRDNRQINSHSIETKWFEV